MIAGGVIAAIGLFLMFATVFQGYSTPYGGVGYQSAAYAQIGLIIMIVGIIILGVSAAIPSPKPHPTTQPPSGPQAPQSDSQLHREAPKEIIRIRCPKCGNINDETANFCNACGSTLRPP